MSFIYYNSNPIGNIAGDCTVRAISKLMDISWDDAYIGIVKQGFIEKDMPSSNSVWDSFLRENGYLRYAIPNTCPNCYTVQDFAKDHPKGRYLLATGSHVIAVIDGDYFDTWDSGFEKPKSYYTKQEE